MSGVYEGILVDRQVYDEHPNIYVVVFDTLRVALRPIDQDPVSNISLNSKIEAIGIDENILMIEGSDYERVSSG